MNTDNIISQSLATFLSSTMKLGQFTSHFYHYCDKMPDKGNLRKEGRGDLCIIVERS